MTFDDPGDDDNWSDDFSYYAPFFETVVPLNLPEHFQTAVEAQAAATAKEEAYRSPFWNFTTQTWEWPLTSVEPELAPVVPGTEVYGLLTKPGREELTAALIRERSEDSSNAAPYEAVFGSHDYSVRGRLRRGIGSCRAEAPSLLALPFFLLSFFLPFSSSFILFPLFFLFPSCVSSFSSFVSIL